jgi:COP9 signalosome complex subunit 6
MQIDGEDHMATKFHPLPYTIDTDETEMIAIDDVAKGAGSAAAVHSVEESTSSQEAKGPTESKGKKRADEAGAGQLANGADEATNPLSAEEEDQIAGITTRLNSVRMLQSRLSLLITFIRSQSSSYLSDQNIPLGKASPDPAQIPHLRNIQALLTRLSLLTPSAESASDTTMSTTADSLTSASLSQSNDVALSSLLAILGQDIQGLSELGRKFASADQERAKKGKTKGGMGTGGFGSIGEFESSKMQMI